MTVPIADISIGLTALKTSIEIVKGLLATKEAPEAQELKLKLSDVVDNLLEAKLKLVDAQEEILTLRRQLESAGNFEELRKLVRIEGNFLLPRKGDLPGYGAGPWCTKCCEVERQFVTLHQDGGSSVNGMRLSLQYICPNCKNHFSVHPSKAP